MATIEGKIIGTGFAGPSNHIDEPGGLHRLRTALEQSTHEALVQAGMAAENVISICLGMTGGPEVAATYIKEQFPAPIT